MTLTFFRESWARFRRLDLVSDPGNQCLFFEKELLERKVRGLGGISVEIEDIGSGIRASSEYPAAWIGQIILEIESDRITSVMVKPDVVEATCELRFVTAAQIDISKSERKRATRRLLGDR